MRLGFHLPISPGLLTCLHEARVRRCQTLQVFTSAPVQWATRQPDAAAAEEFVAARLAADIHPLFIHAPYLLNLATADRELRDKSVRRLITDLEFANLWQAEGVVLHLGSGGDETRRSVVRKRVAAGLRAALARTASPALIILENTAGQGRLVGSTPEELGEIADLAGGERLGLCLDTAHAFAAGYAIHEPEGLDSLLTSYAQIAGASLRLVHANDSLGAFASHRDRHWHIGQGEIGLPGWRTIMAHPGLRDLPFVMETPKETATAREQDWANLKTLRRCIPAEYRPPLPAAPR